MLNVNISKARSSLSRLVKAVEQAREHEIIITRNGRPAAKLVPVKVAHAGKRIGVANGLFEIPDSIDAHSDEVASLFLVSPPY